MLLGWLAGCIQPATRLKVWILLRRECWIKCENALQGRLRKIIRMTVSKEPHSAVKPVCYRLR